MKKFYNSILLVLCLTTTNLVAQNVNITTKINGFRHNWDCCNDGASVLCIGSNFPDPRFKVWIGYNGTTFSQSTNGPGLYTWPFRHKVIEVVKTMTHRFDYQTNFLLTLKQGFTA